MKRKYDISLLDKIKASEQKVVFEGVKVLVKPIPEGGNPGDMDPRLYRSSKKIMLLMKLMPKKKKKPKTLLEQILPLRKMFNTYKGRQIVEDGVTTKYLTVDSADGYKVPIRIYQRNHIGKDLPMFVYYHGGGFFGGSPDVVEQMCKLLVQNLDCVAFNIDYRLCPENHYPAPLDDCFYATKWIFDHASAFGGDNTKLSVSGDSAGGNLAAAVTLRDLEEKTRMVAMQILLYPAIHICGKQTAFYKGVDVSKYQYSKRHESILRGMHNMMDSMLGDGETNMLEDLYLQGNLKADHIFASPMLGDLSLLPPTMLIFGEHDFLVFEDFAYAQAVAAAGSKIKTVVYRGLGHGFADQIGVVPQAEDCIKEIAMTLTEHFCKK